MKDKITEIINKLSLEAQEAAISKCIEIPLDTNRGIVPLEESFANLNSATSTIVDLIENNNFDPLPPSIQRTILSRLESISQYLDGLRSGADELENLVSAMEGLNAEVWQFGLYNLTEEVLNYNSKIEQLKNMELKNRKLTDELSKGLEVKVKLEELINNADQANKTLNDAVDFSTENLVDLGSNLKKATDANNEITAKLASIKQQFDESTKALAETKEKNATVSALEVKIKEFSESCDQYIARIEFSEKQATETINENNENTKNIQSELETLEGKIKDQITKATGYSLFSSFQKRKERIVYAKFFWGLSLLASVIVATKLAHWLSLNAAVPDTAFYLRLALTGPVIFAITFCAKQYSHERKLEEEYAFKSNISVSLTAYREEVEKIVNIDDEKERAKYTSFIIDSIQRVFTSPVDKVFRHKVKNTRKKDSTINEFLELVKALKDAKEIDDVLK